MLFSISYLPSLTINTVKKKGCIEGRGKREEQRRRIKISFVPHGLEEFRSERRLKEKKKIYRPLAAELPAAAIVLLFCSLH